MAAGVVLPLAWPSIGGIMTSALLVGSTFMVNGMASMQEAKAIAGPHATGLMAATIASFAAGQILGPLCAQPAHGKRRPFRRGAAGFRSAYRERGCTLVRRPAGQTSIAATGHHGLAWSPGSRYRLGHALFVSRLLNPRGRRIRDQLQRRFRSISPVISPSDVRETYS